ncbi:hypothetical protein B0H14DRAFT_2650742 [Mycena olivaceomarginata]|nr:hypothetical protein B0H14DRAFT_2650742 [Mycena olivaceomarginata]
MFTKMLLTFTLASLAPKIIGVDCAALEASALADGVGARSDGSGNICPDCVNPKLIGVGSFSGTPNEIIAAPEASASPQGVGARSDGSGNICPDCVNPKIIGGCGN